MLLPLSWPRRRSLVPLLLLCLPLPVPAPAPLPRLGGPRLWPQVPVPRAFAGAASACRVAPSASLLSPSRHGLAFPPLQPPPRCTPGGPAPSLPLCHPWGLCLCPRAASQSWLAAMQRLRNCWLHALRGNVAYSAPRDDGRVALFCPFPQCADHCGWLQSTHLYGHIQREHLNAGQKVPEEWLSATGRKVCPGCHTLVTTASGRCKNPSCANPLGGYLAREAIARRAAG